MAKLIQEKGHSGSECSSRSVLPPVKATQKLSHRWPGPLDGNRYSLSKRKIGVCYIVAAYHFGLINITHFFFKSPWSVHSEVEA